MADPVIPALPSRPASPPRRSGLSTALLGCGIGCGGLIVVAIIIAVATVRWARQSTPLPSAEVLLTESVYAYCALAIDTEDPATRRFVDAVLVNADSDDRAQVQKALPARMNGVLLGDDPGLVFVASLSRYMNLIRLATLPLRFSDDDNITKFRDEIIISDDEENVTFAFPRGGIVIGSDVDSVKYAIERFKDATEGEMEATLAGFWQSLPAGPIRAAAVNADGRFEAVVEKFGERLFDEELPTTLVELLIRSDAITLSGQYGGQVATAIEAELILYVDSPTESELAALRALGPPLAEELEGVDIGATAVVRAAGSRIVIDLQLDLRKLQVDNNDFTITF